MIQAADIQRHDSPLRSLIASGSKVWLDSIDPDFVARYLPLGITGATSNPVIVGDLIKSGRFDAQLSELMQRGQADYEIAWELTDHLVAAAQKVFLPIWKRTHGNDGYVSFELDPLLEDPDQNLPAETRTARYIELGRRWSAGHPNRMIKVPATPAGFQAMEELAAWGVQINVTLIFTQRQYKAARNAIWAGAQRRASIDGFKSVYSVFVSRVDSYIRKHVPLSRAARDQVGIVNAKRLWQLNREFWAPKNLYLQQEMIFASTGTKDPSDPPDKYVEALAGSDILTNPPETNAAVEAGGKTYTRQVDQMPSPDIVEEIDRKVDWDELEEVLLAEGIEKFAKPQEMVMELIASKRKELAGARR